MSSDCVKSIFTPRLARQHQLNEFLTTLIRQLTVVPRRGGRQVELTQDDAVGTLPTPALPKRSPICAQNTSLLLGALMNTPLKVVVVGGGVL